MNKCKLFEGTETTERIAFGERKNHFLNSESSLPNQIKALFQVMLSGKINLLPWLINGIPVGEQKQSLQGMKLKNLHNKFVPPGS